MRGRASVSIALVALGVLLSSTVSNAQSPGHGSHLFIPVDGSFGHRNDTVQSLNWAGYAASGQHFTAVRSTFTVPTAAVTGPGFSAAWTGIGGYDSNDLIQAGASMDSLGTTDYYAWYEMLPAAETRISSGCSSDSTCAVHPRDVITVTVKYNNGTSWTISISNAGHWSWTKNVTYTSLFNSAEWILEAPSLGPVQTWMSNVGTVHFNPNNQYQVNGTNTWLNMATANPDKVVLAFAEGMPSAIDSGGDGFNVCAYATSCSTPGN
ncbi:MAG: G1 family glutamic endopeptidase [Actinomycetota bacterium]|nr:hypothetical protein [Actinomycetota bacterium]